MTEPYNDPYTQMEARAMSMTDEEREARKALTCLFITVSEDVATDVQTKVLAALAAVRESCAKVNLWSLIRTVLEQGGAIQQDYQAGKYPSYEHYSARLDEAAREREELFAAAIRTAGRGNDGSV